MIKGIELLFNQFSGVVIAISIVIIALLYVLSKLFPNQQLQNLFNVEFSEFWVNIGLYLSMGAIVVLSQYVVDYMVESVGLAPSTDIYTFLQLQLSQLQGNVGKEMAFLMMVGQASKIYERAEYTTGYPGAKTVRGKIYPGVGLFTGSIFMVNGMLLVVIGSLTVQQILLDIIKYLAFGFFLPIGVLLRFIPGVRAFGSELIALAISMGLVWPLMYFLMYMAMYDVATIRGGYYMDFVEKNSRFMDVILNPAKTLDEHEVEAEALADTLGVEWDSYLEKESEGYGTQFKEWLKSVLLTFSYAFGYVLNLPIGVLLLYYRLINIGGYIVYAVAVPAFAITFALVSTRAIKDFIHNL